MKRAVGATAGVKRCQARPSHSHVSLFTAAPLPPNITVRARAASKATACPKLPVGGVLAAIRSLHAVPFQTQVSRLKSTTSARLPWNAMAWLTRGDGRTAGAACDQLVPSNCHVSSRAPLASRPPNNTTRWRVAS